MAEQQVFVLPAQNHVEKALTAYRKTPQSQAGV
jgi:hypothetical protein